MTKVLVTGATGFLGRATAVRFRDLGWDVTGLGRDEKIGRQLAAQGIPFLQADLRNRQQIEDACAGRDYVIHCAALSSPWGAYRDFYETNVGGTEHVVSGCVRHGARRLVHVSTPSVYFNYRDRLLVSEQEELPRKPVNSYAATKLMAERVVADAAGNGLSSIIVRPRAVFGPGDTSLFPRLLRVNDSRGIPLIGGGEALLGAARRHLVAREDLSVAPGDVLLFRWRKGLPAKHCAVATSAGTMVHAHDGAAVAEVAFRPWWRRHLAHVFTFPND